MKEFHPLSRLLRRLEGTRLAPFVQFIKFGLVGVSNTLISYAVEMLFLYVILAGMPEGREWTVFGLRLDLRWLICAALGFLAGVINSYVLNSRYVFRAEEGERRSPLAAFLKLAASSVMTSLVLSYFLKLWLNASLGLAPWLASLLALLVTIPLNFLLSKFWAFRTKSSGGAGT